MCEGLLRKYSQQLLHSYVHSAINDVPDTSMYNLRGQVSLNRVGSYMCQHTVHSNMQGNDDLLR